MFQNIAIIQTFAIQNPKVMKELIERYAEYNLWVNVRLVNFLKDQPEEIIDREIISSFPSIRRTLLHIWDAEAIWLSRLKNVSPAAFPSKTFNGSWEDILGNVVANSAQFFDFVKNADEDFLQKPFEYSDLSGNIHRQQPADMIQHCMNHSTFHRGQIITMCRQSGLTALPRTDYIIFVREKSNAQ